MRPAGRPPPRIPAIGGGVKQSCRRDTLEGLRAEARDTDDVALDRRALAVLLVGRDGLNRAKAGSICSCDRRSVFLWQRKYMHRGLDGLRDRPRPGKKPRLSEEQLASLNLLIRSGPAAGGLDVGLWTSPVVADLIQRLYGVKLSPSQVRRTLTKLGLSHQLPRTRLARADRAAQETWLKETLPAICQRMKAEGGRLFFPGRGDVQAVRIHDAHVGSQGSRG